MTKAMPFLQKAILLSYDPRPLDRGVFVVYALRAWRCYLVRQGFWAVDCNTKWMVQRMYRATASCFAFACGYGMIAMR